MNKPEIIEENIPVLIVGGSVVGLSMALFLGWHGIPSLLIERHHSTSIHSRAGVMNARTMELYRQVGLEADIFRLETSAEQLGEMGLHVETLVGKELATNEAAMHQRFQQSDPFASPTRRSMIGQDKLEPLLHTRAAELGANIRFGTEMLTFTQDNDGVTAYIRELATGAEHLIHAHYLVAADGNRSSIRQQLGIASHGYGTLGHWVSIIFRTDLSKYLPGRTISLCFVNNPIVEGIMGQSGDHWALLANLKQHKGEQSDSLSQERYLELVRAAIGVPNQPVEIISTLHWELASRVVEHYQHERIFLAGDAAHVMTTMGGFGANTGIADAHNLAWKLAAVLNGSAQPNLLATYETERLTAAHLAVAVSTGLYAYRLPNHERREAIMQSATEMLQLVRTNSDAPQPTGYSVASGYRYSSTAIYSEQKDTGTGFENEPSAAPGTRAPHLWLTHGDKRLSVLDLYGKNFVLLTYSNGDLWEKAASSASQRLDITLDTYCIGPDASYADDDQSFLATYRISQSGAVLVRPDGFIAWRAHEAMVDAPTTLQNILSHLLSR
ncbi:FAD-dependent monooxygenase [Ktedonospora formicarum]|uniref:FAD-binding monooxygenase n=1 Tax=Ktedonospora formicarum TaxID=2778364 RepID=A0A8J3MUD0_9CHLR|nr:FAD-dependent monooxygenase [Ktedonospora formicarum]GHO46498.1 FAD-binding monooxygenase [Ktedonospora formicarum]